MCVCSRVGAATPLREQVELCDCPSSSTSIKPGRWRLIIRAPISCMPGKFPAKQEMKASKDGGRSGGGFVPVLQQLYEQMAGDTSLRLPRS